MGMFSEGLGVHRTSRTVKKTEVENTLDEARRVLERNHAPQAQSSTRDFLDAIDVETGILGRRVLCNAKESGDELNAALAALNKKGG